MVEFPITMDDMRPLMTAKINDRDVQFTVDSGAVFSILSPASAAALGLKTSPAPYGLRLVGVNGAVDAAITRVKVFTLAGVPLPNIPFLVGGSDIVGGVGVLGQNVLHLWDVEYDLGQGVIRLMKATDCNKSFLAYWVKPGESYSEVDMDSGSADRSHTGAHAYVNGVEIRVVFDTGAPLSVLTLKAAARAGIKPDSPGVTPGGQSGGFGQGWFATYIAPFSSFKLGQEEIKNTHLRIADTSMADTDMLIGADFFLSHHIYVANGQHKLYFTYNGGPVFNLTAKHAPSTTEPSSTPALEGAVPSTPVDATASGSTAASGALQSREHVDADAADLSRRGEALAARREFAQALADLDRACELVPNNADYLYQRGMIHLQLNNDALAMSNFDEAIKLKPNHVDALFARSALRARRDDNEGARADLDALDAALAKESGRRLSMAELYADLGFLQSAAKQYDQWIASHAVDLQLPEALDGRCRVKAWLGVDLRAALKDCNTALSRAKSASPFYAKVADNRGLVLLRLGEYDKSIADYDASLNIAPKNPWSLYGRGIDKARRQRAAEGQADMDQAVAIWPKVADEFKKWGIAPP
jgi:tetratricopeptide (TPR) repeat protein/predicted aspartyl protease